jgi:hypothetical protein
VFAASHPKSCAILLAPLVYVNRRDQLAEPHARQERIFHMAKTLIVSAITALLMILFGIFWMFTWLIGTNGYNGSTGGAILVSNLVLVILSIIFSSVASGSLANMLAARLRWPMWAAAPVVIFGVVLVSVVFLFIGSLIIISVAESMR